MNAKLETLKGLIDRLKHDHGIRVVCVGGAPRDTYLGHDPKDYDLVVLNVGIAPTYLQACLRDAAGGEPVTELGATEHEYLDGDNDRGLLHVFEFEVKIDYPSTSDMFDTTIKCQALVFSDAKLATYNDDPYMIVEDHDCDLNKAWFEEVNGRLVARVHGDFPSPFTGNTNRFRPMYSETTRRDYMRSKFPEFHHIC